MSGNIGIIRNFDIWDKTKNLIMKKVILLLVLLVAMLPSCKTTEENYKASYDCAREQKEATTPLDSTIYARIRQEAQRDARDFVDENLVVVTERVKVTPDQGVETHPLEQYNVMVAQFKQLFNAKSMRDRLRDAGFSDAMVVETAEPLYYVVAGVAPTEGDVSALVKRLRKQSAVAVREPYPQVLKPIR